MTIKKEGIQTLDEIRKMPETKIKDYEDYCDLCGVYGEGIEYFDGENFHSICYKCIEKEKNKREQKYLSDEQKVTDAIKKLPWISDGKGNALIDINVLLKELKII